MITVIPNAKGNQDEREALSLLQKLLHTESESKATAEHLPVILPARRR